jgi:T5SS/PEP-CTERM-associated repeat protein
VINGASSPCVPGAGFVVTNIGGDITLDINTSIKNLLGTAGSLTLNNHTLTATDPLGIQQTGGAVNMSNSSVVNGFLLTNNLQMQSSTINGTAQVFNANINNSTLGPLLLANQLTASNSTFGSNSNLNIASASSISNSTIGGQFAINGGSLTVDTGSIINSTQTLITSGGVTIQGGSTWNASSTPVFLGLAPGSSSVDVTGTGSTLNLAGTALELGQISDSTVTVEHSGKIAATGTGGNFLIGLGAVFPTNSAMYVNSGGTASANKITVAGFANGSTGLLSLSDSSSSITTADELLVHSGGEVIAANQSSLTANSLRIQTGGRVTIDSGATLTLASDAVALVGSIGTGFLTFQGGGTGSGPGQLVVGGSAGSDGSVIITGLGSAWQGTNSVSVGELGAGSVSVINGGLLNTGADADGLSGSIGTQSSGTGTVTLQGGDWQAGGTLQIGAAGSGTLNLLQSGTVESGGATFAVSLGSTGSGSVAGAGSKWTIAGDLTVGSGGNASLSISNGGRVSNNDGTIGELASSTNSSVSVSGLGSRWENSGDLTVGKFGTGSLFISGGAVVTNVNGTIGDKKDSTGSVSVIGLGSSWQNSGILTVGGDGTADLTIDTGSVTAGGAGIGSNFGPVQVTVTNHGSLTILGDVSIGGAGTTDVTIEKGATFENDNSATIGGSGGDTTVTVTGAGSAWTIDGTGDLTLDDKGSLFVTDGGTVTAGTITLLSGSLLNGQGGNIIGSVVNQGGTMTSGDATGVLSITGNYTQTAGSLLFEIDGLGPAQFDQLVISGLANITGGTIDIVFGNGFAPTAGESFELISAGLGLIFTGATFDVTGLPPGMQFTDSIGANGFSIGFGPASQSAPEPAAAVLFGLGLAVVVVRRRLRPPVSLLGSKSHGNCGRSTVRNW